MPLKTAINDRKVADPRIYKEVEPSFYDDQLKSLNPIRRWFHSRRYHLINSFAKSFYSPEKRIIDIGSASSTWNKEHLPVFGLDLNQKLLDYGKDKKRISDYKVGCILSSGLKERSFEIAIATEILEHIQDIDKALNQIHNILTDDGVLIASVPYDTFFSIWRFLFFFQKIYKGYLKGSEYYRNNCGHIHHFSPLKLKSVVIKNGFEVDAILSSFRCNIFLIARKTKTVRRMTCPDLSIIIPVKNEAANIGQLLDELLFQYEEAKIYLVDDGSTDGTIEVIKNKQKANVNIILIDRKDKKVKGLAISVLEAIDIIDTEYFIVMDGDLQHESADIKRIYNQLKQNNDLCVVSRLSVAGWRINRRMISYFGSFLGKIVLFLRRRKMPLDILSGYFGLRTEYWREITNSSKDNFSLRGYKILFDFLKKCNQQTKLADIYHILNARTSGNTKIYWRIYLEYIKSLFRKK